MSRAPSCAVSSQKAEGRASIRCANDDSVQALPRSGALADRLNLDLDSLRERIDARDDIVYCYVIASVRFEGERFVQRGSAPNFQGDLITLCTCKHQMRSRLDSHSWIGKWVAGFSGRGATGDGRRYLVYLMRVGQAFESQQELWSELEEHTRQGKSSASHRFGDLFQPRLSPSDPFNPQSYETPCESHVHLERNGWYRDIAYTGRSKRRPALLVGDPTQSFIWDRPLVAAPFNLPRDYTRKKLHELLSPMVADKL